MIDLSNPIVLIVSGIILLALLYFWNKSNSSKQRNRKKRDFRNGYFERKKDRTKNGNS